MSQALENGLTGISPLTNTATIVDSGTQPWPASLRSHIGRAVSEILRHPDITKNQYLSTASFNVSQNQVLAIVEELTGKKFAVTRADSKDIFKSGEEKLPNLAKGDHSAFVDFLKAYFLADGAGNELKDEDSANEKLCLQTEDVRAVVKGWLEKKGLLAA